jgi:uncharacterized glyoxalase superfamily protein PhnB
MRRYIAANGGSGSINEAMVHFGKSSMRAETGERAVVPIVPYRNAMAMVDWLSDVYGLEKRRVVKDENGEVKRAELAFGDSVIMVVPVQDATLERLVVHPDQIGGVETQTCYMVVADIDAHYARATAKGAEIVSGIQVRDRDRRSYASRDPEGHIWMFGTFNPSQVRPREVVHDRRRHSLRRGAPLLAAALVVLIAAIAAAAWTFTDMLVALEADGRRMSRQEPNLRPSAERDAKSLADELVQVHKAKESAERNVTGLVKQLSQARAALEIAVQSEKEARGLLAQQMRAKEGLVLAAKQAGGQLWEERTAREAAEKRARDATDQLSTARLAKMTAERVAKETAEKCDLDRKSRSLAENSARDVATELARERSAKAAAELAASELRNQLAAIPTVPQGVVALRDQVDTERRAKERFERAAKDAQLQLAQERYSRDATERELRQTQDRLAAASCWSCPTGAPCNKP